MPAIPSISGPASPPAGVVNTKKKKNRGPRDPVREALETVVFVVVLVLLLKLFAVEAFVIPTGSMAETLYGYHKWVECPECGIRFPVNCSDESDPQGGALPTIVKECTCPNCRYEIRNDSKGQPIPSGDWNGDRVLVLKAIYHVEDPERGQVVVFKYPKEPQKQHQAQNYIKRLWGRGGETLAIHRTKVFIAKGGIDYSGYAAPDDPLKAWEPEYRFHNAAEAVTAFNAAKAAGFPAGGTFELFRKSDEMVLAMRRLVYDNNHQAKSLVAAGAPPRWAERDGSHSWTPDNAASPKVFTHAGDDRSWIRYRHLIENVWANPPKATEARITNFMGYNTSNMNPGKQKDPADYWASDLMLECTAKIDTGGEIAVELSRGVHRYQARFANGQVTLVRITGTKEETLTTAPCPVTGPGEYVLRFANVDCRLRVWVKKVGFFGVWKRVELGAAADYPFAPIVDPDPLDRNHEGLTKANDLDAPASVGAKGPVTVKDLILYRDTVYTHMNVARPDDMADYVDTYYVQPGHYMCLGDNSAQSSDSRDWGAVPERLMLGRAVFVFWPAFPVNRIGLIK
ncbi:MAG TPA: S26 family signal peptidase [Fimbriiglobus sp.]|jgi:signal peptidase I